MATTTTLETIAGLLVLARFAVPLGAWAARRWRWERDHVIGLPRLVRRVDDPHDGEPLDDDD